MLSAQSIQPQVWESASICSFERQASVMHWRLKSLIWQGVTVATAMDQLLNRLTKCRVQATWPCGGASACGLHRWKSTTSVRHVTASRQRETSSSDCQRKTEVGQQMTTTRRKWLQRETKKTTTPEACCVSPPAFHSWEHSRTLWLHPRHTGPPLKIRAPYKQTLTLPSVPMVTLDHRWGAAESRQFAGCKWRHPKQQVKRLVSALM